MQRKIQPQTIENTSIQAAIFDLDGVLLDSEWMTFLTWRELARRYGGTLDDATFPEVAGTTAEQTAEIVMRRTGIAYDITESVAWAWQHVIERIRAEAEPLPGAAELVQDLAQRGLLLAIASNSPTSYVDDALTGLKMTSYFPLRVGVEQVSEGKPAPDLYLRAANLLGVLPSRCLVIEDSRVGVQAGAAAGMRVLAIPGERDHKHGFDGAWRVYPSLVKVREDLAAILS